MSKRSERMERNAMENAALLRRVAQRKIDDAAYFHRRDYAANECASWVIRAPVQAPATQPTPGVALSEQAVCDMLREKSVLTEKGMALVLNGDFVSLNVTAITAVANAAIAQPQQPATSAAVAPATSGNERDWTIAQAVRDWYVVQYPEITSGPWSPPIAEIIAAVGQQDDVRDAARWRALLGSARIRMIGSTGLVWSEPNNYAHFNMEIWTKYSRNYIPELLEEMDQGTAQGREWLIKYADIAIAALTGSAG